MRILMINPPTNHIKGSINPRIFLPLGLLYLAAVLEKYNHEIKIYDTRLSTKITKKSKSEIHFGDTWDEIKKKIEDFNPEIICISSMFSNQSSNTIKVAELAKKVNKKILVIIGGSHPSVDTTLINNNSIDIQVIGEGELTLLGILDYYQGKKKLKDIEGICYKEKNKVKIIKKKKFIDDLDQIPFPAYHLVNMEEYFHKQHHSYGARPLIRGKRVISMITSRGCPYNCVFCSIFLSMGRKFRYHSSKYVLDHIQFLKEKYNIDFILFEDDNMNLELKRFEEILDGMIERKLNNIKWGVINGLRADTLDKRLMLKAKKAGCAYIVIAIESGVQRVINDIIKKNLDLKKVIQVCKESKEIKMEMYSFYIIGLPDEKKDEIRQTINFAMMLDNKYGIFPQMNIATPLLGTELFKICKEKGYLTKDVNEESLLTATQFYGDGLIKTPEFTPDDLKKESNRLNKNILKNLIKRSFSNPKLFFNYLSTTLRNPYLIKKYIFEK